MSTCTVKCPHCNAVQTVAQESLGQTIRCASCGNLIQLPQGQAGSGGGDIDAGMVFCTKCGQRNAATSTTCLQCGVELLQVVTVESPGEQVLCSVIPYKNPKALLAYYFAVFALIPCVGLFLGYAALVLGILGLRYAKAHPEARGKVHAWIGIILGGLCGIGYTLLIVIPIVMALIG
jgi:ribosomal protein S27E